MKRHSLDQVRRHGCKSRAPAMQSGIAWLLAAVVTPPLLVVTAAKAIPDADAFKKLRVIPVFIITDPKGVPMPIPRAESLVLPLYLDSMRANQELKALNKSNPSVKAIITPVSLDVMNEKVVELNKMLKDKSKPLVAPIMIDEADRQHAFRLLKDEGLTHQQIDQGMSVPVFFTKPFITLNMAEGRKGVFFFSYDQLQRAISQTPEEERRSLKPLVADLSVVIQEIIKDPKDNFVIYPTSEYFRLMKASNPLNKSVLSQTKRNGQTRGGGNDFGSCYSSLITRFKHGDASFLCNCWIQNASRFASSEGASKYCSNALSSQNAQETNKVIGELMMREIFKPMPVAAPAGKGADMSCSLARAAGLPCAGDKRVRCRDTVNYWGHKESVCEEF
jgi:hypothetical protein